MRAFTRETSPVVFVPGVNCDTDQIIPARFIKADRAEGYDQFLFHDIRRDAEGALDPDFPLNRPGAEKARILLVEDNFGCGSSREGAVYALVDAGIRALIAPGFGDIFYNNALKNGVVPVRLPLATCEALADHLATNPAAQTTVDLAAGLVTLPGNLGSHAITLPLKGLDEIEMTFTYMDRITAFEAVRLTAAPWLAR